MGEAGLILSNLFQEESPEASRLAEQSQVWSLRYTPEPTWLNGKAKRRIFHWGLGPVMANFKAAFLEQKLDRYLNEYEVELFSFDLGPAARLNQNILPLSPPLGPDGIFRYTDSALKFIRQYYNGPLAVENYNFYPTGLYEHITDPRFISAYLNEFDLGLTLDLAHGAITAYNLGLSPEDYFESLPLDKTAEIHISRPWLPQDNDRWGVDSHFCPSSREWSWLEKIINNNMIPNTAAVFVEYYGDLGKLEEAQKTLTAILRI